MERWLALAENGARSGIWSQPQWLTRLFSSNGFPPGEAHSLTLPPSLDELWRAGAATGTTDGCFARLSMTEI
jgi:hypothetical protein